MPKYAIGVDFGTESGRALLVDVADAELRQALLTDPLQRASWVKWLGEPMALKKVLLTGVARLARSPRTTL